MMVELGKTVAGQVRLARCEERLNEAIAQRVEQDVSEEHRAQLPGEAARAEPAPAPAGPSLARPAQASDVFDRMTPTTPTTTPQSGDGDMGDGDDTTDNSDGHLRPDGSMDVDNVVAKTQKAANHHQAYLNRIGMPNQSTTHKWRISTDRRLNNGGKRITSFDASETSRLAGTSPYPLVETKLTCGDIHTTGPTASERSGARWRVPPDEPAMAKPQGARTRPTSDFNDDMEHTNVNDGRR